MKNLQAEIRRDQYNFLEFVLKAQLLSQISELNEKLLGNLIKKRENEMVSKR